MLVHVSCSNSGACKTIVLQVICACSHLLIFTAHAIGVGKLICAVDMSYWDLYINGLTRLTIMIFLYSIRCDTDILGTE
jgi:hypothetical protein